MEPWIWAIMLLVLAATFGALEMFIPSGGILAFLSIASIVAGVFVAFMDGPYYGLGYLIVTLTGVPIALYWGIKTWPHTPIGKRILLDELSPEDVLPDSPGYSELKALVGRTGLAKSKMLPAGAIVIDGRTYDAFSEGEPIEPGDPVKVLEVHGVHITVRKTDDPVKAASTSSSASDAGLTQPFDTLKIDDPFADDPLGDSSPGDEGRQTV